MKSTYIIYFKAMKDGYVLSTGNFEITATNPGEGFLSHVNG